MAQAARLHLRMQKELKLLLTDPPHGASFPFLSADSDLSSLSTIDAQIEGPEGTVYAEGLFKLKIQIPERYPFQPPSVTFATPIYHPNIDNGGRICLDILNLPPKGAWQPSLNISTVITSIGLLLNEPNPDDGLMCEASKEYKYNRQAFDQKARAMMDKYAKTGASKQNCRSQCIQNNEDLSTAVEVKLSEVSNYEVNDIGSCHNMQYGISRKLSLEPSSATQKRDSDEEANDVPNPLLDLENMEAKREKKELRDIPDKYNHRYEKPCGTGRRLSLESSAQFHKRNCHDMKDGGPNHSKSLCDAQSLSLASLESPLLQGGSSHELQLHQHHDGKSKYDCKITSSKKLCPVSQETMLSVDACQTHNANNEKMFVTPAKSPSQSHSNSSPAILTTLSSVNHSALWTSQNSMDKLENGSTDIKLKRLCSIRKKLSLGFRSSSGGQEKDVKDTVLLIHNSFPSAKTQWPVGIGQKQSPGFMSQLQGMKEDNRKLFSCSGEFTTNESQKQQSDQHQNSKPGEINQRGDESQVTESIIVLDSEDSEEESNGSIRSKLSIARMRMTKRKTQA